MKHKFSGMVVAVLAITLLFGSVPAYASNDTSNAEMTGNSAVDALHSGPPPLYPTQRAEPSVTPAVSGTFTPLPSLGGDRLTNSKSNTEAVSESPALPALYPSDVQGTEENGVRWIVKTYELGPGERPEAIPRDSFERDGWKYAISDIIRKETAAAETKEHTETVTVNSDTKEMDAIIGLLEPTINFTNGDGYTGTLELDIATVKVALGGRPLREMRGRCADSSVLSAKRKAALKTVLDHRRFQHARRHSCRYLLR